MGRPGLMRHRKFARLARLLDSKFVARGVLEVVWEAAYENGDELLGDALDLETLVGWPGEPGKLAEALVDSGFVDLLDGLLAVHDLWDHAPDYVRRRAEREGDRRKKGQSLSDIRAEAGRIGGLAKASKRNSLATPHPSKPLANVSTRAPARARAPAQKDCSASPTQKVEEQPTPKKPSAQQAIVASLAAARLAAHPALTPWETDTAAAIKRLNALFAVGKDIRTAHDADPALFVKAWDRYLADPYWQTAGGWPLGGFVGAGKWRELLDSVRALEPSDLFKNAIEPGAKFPDPYAEEGMCQ